MGLDYFLSREKQLLGGRFETLYAAPNETAARGVTVSSLRCTPEAFAARADFSVESSQFCAAGFVIKESTFKPGFHPYHAAGVFYSQEPSASSAAPLLDVKPGMRVLDFCAAPGGKSSQLLSALGGHGLLVSNEYAAERAEILKQNLERMGAANALVLNETTGHIAAALPEFFDRVLVDSPCSGEGMFRKEPQAAAQHCEALVQQCAAFGAQILDDAAAVLAPGGIMVYSTCTFAPEEDEGQIGAFLSRHPEFALLPALDGSPLIFGSEGEANRCGAHPFDVSLVRRIWPCQGGEGHFLAKLQKAGTPRALPPEGERTGEESAWLAAMTFGGQRNVRTEKRGKGRDKRGEGKPAAASAVLAAWRAFAAENAPELVDLPAVVRGENVLLVPAFPQTGLHILRAGVFAGSLQKERFVPAHHLFTAYGTAFINREMLTLADPRTLSYLRGEEIAAQTADKGWCCVMADGFPLGGGKASEGRVKNHYPKALRFH